MSKDAYLTLRISGETDSGKMLSVATYDINELAEKLKTIRTLIDPEGSQNTIALAQVEEGSVGYRKMKLRLMKNLWRSRLKKQLVSHGKV